MGSFVIIESAAGDIDYMRDYVTLPKNYGKAEYFGRVDVAEIYRTVYTALDTLDSHSNFTDRMKGKPVFIKPNLVSVYHHSGLDDVDYPESTDPRVFDAVIAYIKRFSDRITIVESSGKPMPTTVSFKSAGYDRIAKYHKTGLIPLELCPVVRYMLPKAEVMKEVYLPDILQPVVNGEAFYISVPKMKTNLYAGVTLSFKNAMGTLPYFLRERNHNYRINEKLADLLYLFKPDLTVIDGIIGGEGNTPAPVDPVRVGKIIASNNSVEADRITTYMMGFDPAENRLMIEASKRGFGDKSVTIIGDTSRTVFRPAIASLMDEKTRREFPNLLAVAGHTKNSAPKVTDPARVTPETALALEQACTGGCLSATKTGLDYLNYKKKTDRNFHLCVVIGEGVLINGMRYWFDRDGKAYSLDDLDKLPMAKFAMGDCASTARSVCRYSADGCCDPAKCMSTVCKAAGTTLPVTTPANRAFFPIVTGILKIILKRRKLIKQGFYVDCPHEHRDEIFELPEIGAGDKDRDFIEWPLPPMSREEKSAQLKSQMSILRSII